MTTIASLKMYLEQAWCQETALGEWRSDVPSLNQCAITALVVQDFYGGEILRCKMTDGDSHYWNLLPSGKELDLTSDQFEYIEPQLMQETREIITRQYILSYPKTMKRYGVLLHRLSDWG